MQAQTLVWFCFVTKDHVTTLKVSTVIRCCGQVVKLQKISLKF